jgi:hypothetical protein
LGLLDPGESALLPHERSFDDRATPAGDGRKSCLLGCEAKKLVTPARAVVEAIDPCLTLVDLKKGEALLGGAVFEIPPLLSCQAL